MNDWVVLKNIGTWNINLQIKRQYVILFARWYTITTTKLCWLIFIFNIVFARFGHVAYAIWLLKRCKRQVLTPHKNWSHGSILMDEGDGSNIDRFKSPRPGMTNVFSSFPSRPPPQRLFPHVKGVKLNLRYLGQRIYRSVMIECNGTREEAYIDCLFLSGLTTFTCLVPVIYMKESFIWHAVNKCTGCITIQTKRSRSYESGLTSCRFCTND